MTHTERVCLHVLGDLLEGLSERSGRGLLGGAHITWNWVLASVNPLLPSGGTGLWEVKVHRLVRGERRLWEC